MTRDEYEIGRAYARFAHSANPKRSVAQFFKQCHEGGEPLAIQYCRIKVVAFGGPDPLDSDSLHGANGAEAVRYRALWRGSDEPTLLSPARYAPSRLPK